jgi:hypothetical protein
MRPSSTLAVESVRLGTYDNGHPKYPHRSSTLAVESVRFVPGSIRSSSPASIQPA